VSGSGPGDALAAVGVKKKKKLKYQVVVQKSCSQEQGFVDTLATFRTLSNNLSSKFLFS